MPGWLLTLPQSVQSPVHRTTVFLSIARAKKTLTSDYLLGSVFSSLTDLELARLARTPHVVPLQEADKRSAYDELCRGIQITHYSNSLLLDVSFSHADEGLAVALVDKICAAVVLLTTNQVQIIDTAHVTKHAQNP
jgi:hypothetical protein